MRRPAIVYGIIQCRAQLRHAEIQHFHVSIRLKPEIGGFYVAVKQSETMRMLDPAARLKEDTDGFRHGERPVSLNTLRKILSFKQFHHKIRFPIEISRVHRRDDIRMKKSAGRDDLLMKTFRNFRRNNFLVADKFHGNFSVKHLVLRLIDDPHSPFSKHRLQLVQTDRLRQLQLFF